MAAPAEPKTSPPAISMAGFLDAISPDKLEKIKQDDAAKQQAQNNASLTGGVTNTGTGGLSNSTTQVAGGVLGLGHETLNQYGVDSAAWKDQSGGARAAIDQRYQHLTGNATPQAAGMQAANVAVNPANQQQQSALSNMLLQQAQGNGPSAAQAQLQAGNSAAIAAQMAMARSSNDPNAMRQAQFNAATQTQQNANQAAQLRAQEMQSGRSLAAQQFEGARGQDLSQRGQDIGQNQFNAGQEQQNQQFNQGMKQQTEALISDYINKGMTLAEANRQAQIDAQKTQYAVASGNEAARMGYNNAGNNQFGDFIGKGLETVGKVGTAVAMSDERAKTNVQDGGKDVRGFLDAISASKYEYKDEHKAGPFGGKGTYVSPMAQELEKTKLGKSMVSEDETGTKIVDYGKGFGAMLAALADTNKRLKKIGA